MALSPDGTRAALMTTDGVTWKDYASWQDKGKLAHPSPMHVLWLGDDELLVAGAFFIERFTISTSTSTFVALSQPGEFGHAQAGHVLARRRAGSSAFDETAGTWKALPRTRSGTGAPPRTGTACTSSPRRVAATRTC